MNHGKIKKGSSSKIASTILFAAYFGLTIGKREGNFVWTPSNIPVLIKYGHIQVVFTLDLLLESSILKLSSNPIAAYLDAE
jgi:hypothetical protein